MKEYWKIQKMDVYMKRFNRKGMLIFPNPIRKTEICKQKDIIVIEHCYCHNGHSLITDRAVFNGFNGIILKICREKLEGLVALSPVYGYKSRVSLDLQLKSGEIWKVCCPECNEALPIFSECSCQARIFTLFLDKKANFSKCILLCNRIDCFNAEIKLEKELEYYSGGYLL